MEPTCDECGSLLDGTEEGIGTCINCLEEDEWDTADREENDYYVQGMIDTPGEEL